MDLRVDRAKPRADSIATALARGATLEQAAQRVGLKPVAATAMTRSQPDPQLAGTPEVIGAMFAATPGKVVGPIRGFGGWYFARVERRAVADTATFEKNKGQLSSDLMTRRQQSFFNSFVNRLLASAKVQDLRYEAVR
jgi:parvulin-like peptidyl-prolyl isomerase